MRHVNWSAAEWICVCVLALFSSNPTLVAASGGEPSGGAKDAAATAAGEVPAVPRSFWFHGVLQDAAGAALTGVQGVTFALYAEQTGGAPLWLETQNVQADEQGRYSVLLGSMRADGLPQEFFTSNEARWLGVRLNQPGAEEQARVLLVSVPYALKAADAETLGGQPLSAFVLAPTADKNGEITAAATDSLPAAAAGTSGKLAKFDVDNTTLVNSVMTESSGKIGLGVSTPAETLEVDGNLRLSNTGQLKFHAAGDGSPRYQMGVSGAGGMQFQSLDGVTPRKFFLVSSTGTAFFQVALETGDLTDFGKVGVGTFPLNMLDAAGGTAIGSYAGANAAPANGLIVSGNVGIGTTSPSAKLEVSGGDVKVSGGGKFVGDGTGLTGIPTLVANTFTGSQTVTGTVSASTSSTADFTNAISGSASGLSGQTRGVSGVTSSTTNNAAGVVGSANGGT